MFITGAAIFARLVFLFVKVKRRTGLRLLHYDMLLGLAVMNPSFAAKRVAEHLRFTELRRLLPGTRLRPI